MRTSARHWGCLSAFRASQGLIPHSTNARTPLFWQRPSSGWRPIRNAPTRLSTSPTVISSGGRTYGPSSPISSGWNWLRRDTSTLRGPWRTRGRSGKKLSQRTDCRNSASKRLRPGTTRTGYSHRITISSPIPGRSAVSDSTTSWTPRRCFFGCFRTFGVSGSFRDLPNVLAGDWAAGGADGPPFTKDLACARWIISRRHWRRSARSSGEPIRHASSSTRDQVVHLGEKHFEKRGRVRPVIANHQIDRRYFALQWAADDRWRKKISRIKGQQGEATRGYDD